jgi:hypothetical protein
MAHCVPEDGNIEVKRSEIELTLLKHHIPRIRIWIRLKYTCVLTYTLIYNTAGSLNI